MKKSLSLLISVFFLFLPSVRAHEEYQPFIVINGKHSFHNEITDKTSPLLETEHEIAPEDYIVLRPVYFKIDTFKLGKSTDWIRKAEYYFDFGDGMILTGAETSHTFKQTGTHRISVYARTEEEPQLLTTVKLQIIPMKNYRLPRAAMKVNDFKTGTSYQIPFDEPVRLEATAEDSSAKINEFIWDLGDGNSRTGKQLEHTFSQGHYNAVVLLRVKDENGFTSDSAVELVNSLRVEGQQADNKREFLPDKILIGLVGVAFLIILFFYVQSKIQNSPLTDCKAL